MYVTREKMRELEAELQHLTTTARKEIAAKIAEARSHGDLSENADYDAAKEEQRFLEAKITALSHTLATAQVIDASDIKTDKIYILTKAKVKNLKTKKVLEYSVVGEAESDFTKNKISTSSPLGKAMLGKKVGERFILKLPAGETEFEVLEINVM